MATNIDFKVKNGLQVLEGAVIGGTSPLNNGKLSVFTTSTQNAFAVDVASTTGIYTGLYVNRSGSDGELITFDRAGSRIAALTNIGTSLAITMNSVEKVRIDSTGNVGIGGTAQFPLDVVRAATTYAQIRTTASNAGVGLILNGSTTQKNWVIASQLNVDGGLEFTQTTTSGGNTISTVPSMVIDAARNVGIGTTTPGSRLTVIGGVQVGPFPAAAGYDYLSVQSTNGLDVRLQAQGNSSVGSVGTYSAHPFYLYTNNTERVRIDTVGNVGVGTQAPTRILDVVGAAARFRGDSFFHEFYNTANTVRSGYLQLNAASTSRLAVEVAQPLAFQTSGVDRMTITAAGSVGIGIASPADPLHVIGAGRFSNGTNAIGLGADGTGSYLEAAAGAAVLVFKTAAVERMRLDGAGNVTIPGSLYAATKSFLIDHPSKPGMKLRYGSLESPYHGIRLTGSGVVKHGVCRVELPEYIRDLVKDEGAQVQITNVRHGKCIWVESIFVDENAFVVLSETLDRDLEFFWSFTAVRKDVPDMIVEE